VRYAVHVASFLVGVLMAAGLAVAGMTQPHKIVAFLDFFGGWEPDLMFVMGGATVVTFVLYRVSFRRPAPLLSQRFLVPTRRDLDGRLLAGAALFGVGWGLTGICPGPALTSTATGALTILAFLVGMVAGMFLLGLYDRVGSVLRARLREPAVSPK